MRWRRMRHTSLIASGLPLPWPWRIASAEARARQYVASVIGREAALSAEFKCVSRTDELSFALIGGLAGLSEQQIDKLNASLLVLTP